MHSRIPIGLTVLLAIILMLSSFRKVEAQPSRSDFRIQVASSSRYFPVPRIQSELNVKDSLTVFFLNGRYKYFVGSFSSFQEGQDYLANVSVQGAWVVRIPDSATEYKPAIQTEKSTDRSLTTDATRSAKPAKQESVFRLDRVYAVQIAASRYYIRPESMKDKFKLSDEVRYFRKDGWYKYVVGTFKTSTEAAERLSELAITGFVVSYDDTVRSTVQPAEKEKQQSQLQRESGQTIADTVLQQDSSMVFSDTLAAAEDTLGPLGSEAELKALYNQRVTEALSAKKEGNLLLARKLFREASKIDPSKIFPNDEIFEIDRLLKDKQSKPLLDQIKPIALGIFAFVFIMIAVLVITLIIRTRRQKLDRQKQNLREQYQDSITEYLFDENASQPENLKEANTHRKQQILIDEIMQLYANLSGEISNKLRELYLDLGLDNESVQKTKSPQWHIRAKGFRELAQMNIQSVNDEIERCLNSSNDILRMEAQLAMIRLNFDDPFSFLNKLDQPFTSWEQLHVYEMIQRYQIAVPEFSRWLSSSNETIIIFSIRMIRAFKQDNAFPMLVPFLQHENYEIREETFMTLGELGNPQALTLLKERFSYEAQPGRLQILRAMGKIPDETNVEFLRGVLEPSSELRLEAADALARIETFGVKGIETILRRSDEDLQAVARHILDNKISR